MTKANTRPKTRGRRPATRNTSGKSGATQRKRPAAKNSVTKGVLAPYRRDIQGLALLLLAVLAALGVWWHASSPGLLAVETFLRGAVGYGAFGVPLLFGVLAAAVLRDQAPSGDAAGRVAIGSVLVVLGSLGLIHLLAGGPGFGEVEIIGGDERTGAGIEELQRSGGFVGSLLAGPLAGLLSAWGAGAVFACVLFLGLLIVTKTPLAAVGRALSTASGWVTDLFQGQAEPATAQPATPAKAGGKNGKSRKSEKPERATVSGQPPTADTAEDPTAAGDDGGSTSRRRRARPKPEPTYEQPPLTDADAPPEEPEPEPAPAAAAKPVPAERPAPPPPPPPGGPYEIPPGELLARSTVQVVDERRIEEMEHILETTFDQFEVDAHVSGRNRGPTVTMYEVELGPATKVNKVVGLGKDIAYALASPDVRIIAPIPGKSAIGIEVPNRDRDLVTLGDVLYTDVEPEDDKRPPLTVALGKDISNQAVVADLAGMPHVLIAGATGAGKSVALNGLVTSLLMRNPPDRVRMILIDPKRVEMSNYEGAPHLITPVVTHPKRAAEALDWAVREMEMRLETLALAGMRNITAYNAAAEAGELPGVPTADLDENGHPVGETKPEPLPYIVLVIDELADLMMVAPRDVEDAICRIAQMARAVGIHLVVATQRPSVDVVTGLIKANIPSRIAFMVASAQDSRVILDTGGAEKLIGHGDMLFLPGGTSKPRRVQGAFITEKEVAEVVGFCKAQQGATYQSGVVAEGRKAAGDDDGDEDPMIDQARDIIVRSGLGSTSMLQSKMKVGFSRARRIMDQLEQRGVVGPSEGSKPRDVLMTVEQLDELTGRESTYSEMEGS